tara:strand:+ start:192 stop:314 length:123 start_codon:yes stop_codon:yes gene_type:complete
VELINRCSKGRKDKKGILFGALLGVIGLIILGLKNYGIGK